jgi:pimeloyl-ACP methyl ester carboxylesterase
MTLHVIDRVAVDDEGEGDAVVCIHGLGGSSNTFGPLMGALAHHRVVRIDLPGSARSQAAAGELSIERFVDTVVSICERLHISRAHFVGHSMGTIVCQHLALSRPKLVRSLVLFGPLLSPPDAARTALRARASKAQTEGPPAMQEIATALLQASLSANTRQRQPVVLAFVRESLLRQQGESYGRTCEALANAQAAEVQRIEVPVLLVTGDEDGVAPPQAVRAMAERFQSAASARVVVLPRCGHWTPIERPEECARELREILAVVR